MYYYYHWSCTTPLYVYARCILLLKTDSHFYHTFFWYFFGRCLYIMFIKQLFPFPKKKQLKELLFIVSCYEPRTVLEFFTDIISISHSSSIRDY